MDLLSEETSPHFSFSGLLTQKGSTFTGKNYAASFREQTAMPVVTICKADGKHRDILKRGRGHLLKQGCLIKLIR